MSNLGMTLNEVRQLIGEGDIVGDGQFYCCSVASLDRADPAQLSFVKDRRHAISAQKSEAGALLVPEPIDGLGAHQLVVEQPWPAFLRILDYIAEQKRKQPSGIHPRASISAGVEIGEDVTIGAGACLREGVRVGDRVVLYANVYVGQRSVIQEDSVIHPNVVIMEDVSIGRRVVVHSGTVIGADGYGFLQHEGKHVKIPQVGAIEIGDDVEIGALTTIDRATIDKTVIGRGTKVGDLVHVAHNCLVGEDVLLLPTVALAGSSQVGNHVVMAGRSGISENVKVGDGAMLGATCVSYKDVPAGKVMWGNPARAKTHQIRIEAALDSLPSMRSELRALKKKLDE